MRGLNKYDEVYGIPIGPELQTRSGRLGAAEFAYLHDIEASAVGEYLWGGEGYGPISLPLYRDRRCRESS